MKIGVLIPDRGDRPEFLANCMRMLERQTLKPHVVELVNDPPKNDDIDITYRYRIGYERFSGKGVDLIAFIENDDWYASNYLELHAAKWRETGMPVILGSNFTIYYHIRMQKHFTFYHDQRSSAMNTFLRPNQNIFWGEDTNPYTDLTLWDKLRGVIWQPPVISVGMKHGFGKCGGFAHTDFLERYSSPDNGFLERTLRPDDEEGYLFYQKFKNP